MDWLSALILGLVQGLTEFLPVSSSGHLELGKVILGLQSKENITFSIIVHGATVLSTIVVFRNDIWQIIKETFKKDWNDSKSFIVKIAISVIPVAIIGVFFKDVIEQFFTGNLIIVGSMLMITAILLAFTHFAKFNQKPITYFHSLVIGIAQAIAVMPGISRSGATISTGLLLGNKREEIAKFSFLMVLVPIIAANILDLKDLSETASTQINWSAMLIGFIAAFISGLLACKWMIKIVQKSKLIYFAVYCFIIASIAIYFGLR